MAIPKKVLKVVQERDSHCWHCGREDDLVPHHRINRGMGGSKYKPHKGGKDLDAPANLMMVCALWNGAMESNAKEANAARGWGHKLAIWEDLDTPVFDRGTFKWWILSADGTKVALDDIPF